MQILDERDLEARCGGCGKEHKQKFDSEWDEHSRFMHYKTTKCEHCGYKISFKTDFETSGL